MTPHSKENGGPLKELKRVNVNLKISMATSSSSSVLEHDLMTRGEVHIIILDYYRSTKHHTEADKAYMLKWPRPIFHFFSKLLEILVSQERELIFFS